MDPRCHRRTARTVVSHRAVALIDGAAFRSNVAWLDERSGDAALMVVVKADAYGHGMVNIARMARGMGVPWLGVALLSEARALREDGDIGRILAWLWAPDDPDLDACIRADVDISVSHEAALDAVIASGARVGCTPRVQVKVDTGLSRNGVPIDEWAAFVSRLQHAEEAGQIMVDGVWSHLANADAHDQEWARESVAKQCEIFRGALHVMHDAGLQPEWIHLANTAGLLWFPECHFTLVRAGIGTYGVSPGAPSDLEHLSLNPVMTLRAQLAHVKTIPAGQSVSYGSRWTAPAPTRVGLVAMGYADGLPRIAEDIAVHWNGMPCPVLGRIAMDQCVVAVPEGARIGDWVTIFGVGGSTADEWGQAAGTIGYEIVTRIGPRVPREVQ
jgi:alanine racemase